MAVGTGVLTEADFRAGANQVYADPRFKPDFRAFYDFTEVKGWSLTTDFLVEIAAGRKFSQSSKTAILVGNLLGY